MVRKSRLHFRGAVYHVMLKSQAEVNWLGRRSDRNYWESLLDEGRQRFGHKIHAFSWSKNRASLCVEVADVPLPRIVQNFTFRFVRYFNQKYNLSGPLFDGRYQATIIQPEIYLTDLVRYIHREFPPHRNSKRVRFSKSSSHQSYLGTDYKPFLTTETVLSYFGSRKGTQIARYKKFVNADIDDEIASKFAPRHGSAQILGSPKFRRKVKSPTKPREITVTLSQVIQLVCKEEKIQESLLKANSRNRQLSQIRQLICCIALELEICTLTDISSRFNRDLSTMSRNQRYFRENPGFDEKHRKKISGYKRALLKKSRKSPPDCQGI